MPSTSRTTTQKRSTPGKNERLAVRVSREQRNLLDEASRATQTTVSEFVLSAATRAAEDVLADRTRFVLSPDRWHEFVRLLDSPPRSLPRLRGLLETSSVLDEA